MALKAEGYPVEVWEEWSRNDGRYHPGECEKKWFSFSGDGITGATITQMAKDRGWHPREREERTPKVYDWDDYIGVSKAIADESSAKEDLPLCPSKWNGVDDLIKYLETLFDAEDKVSFVSEAMKRQDEKWCPKTSGTTFPVGEMLTRLKKHRDDISAVIGDYMRQAGAWIRFNPMDGQGAGNANVTSYRYALIESDSLPLEKQWALLNEMKLPIAAVVHSGGKSVHAIVKVYAKDKDEYDTRVRFLFDVCKKSGFDIDQQNKNPSRLSRMPGVYRANKPQYLIATNIGLGSWDEWTEYVKMFDNDLPDPELITSTILERRMDLPEEIIEGVLRRGRNMILSSGSKAGKTFAMIELAIAVATGGDWLGFKCKKGSVLYVDFELERDYFIDRMQHICKASNVNLEEIENFYYMDMRGFAAPMDKLKDKIIHKAKSYKNLSIVILDPIYKILGGDESDMTAATNFGNTIDSIGKALNCSIVYVHHHSKGGQSGKKAIDRASGSSVLGRQNDAILDMCDIEITDEIREQFRNQVICEELTKYYGDRLSDYEKDNAQVILNKAQTWAEKADVQKIINRCDTIVNSTTALRIEGSLRDFRSFKPFNIWFKYPIHIIDKDGILDDSALYGEMPANEKGGEKTKAVYKAKAHDNDLRMFNCFQKCQADAPGEEVTTAILLDKVNDSLIGDGKKTITDDTIRNWLKRSEHLELINRGKEKGKYLPAFVRRKFNIEDEIHEEFPEGF